MLSPLLAQALEIAQASNKMGCKISRDSLPSTAPRPMMMTWHLNNCARQVAYASYLLVSFVGHQPHQLHSISAALGVCLSTAQSRIKLPSKINWLHGWGPVHTNFFKPSWSASVKYFMQKQEGQKAPCLVWHDYKKTCLTSNLRLVN